MQLDLSPRENLEATKQDIIHRNGKWHNPTVSFYLRLYENKSMRKHFQVK